MSLMELLYNNVELSSQNPRISDLGDGNILGFFTIICLDILRRLV